MDWYSAVGDYMTVPVGYEPKGLSVLMMSHRGLWMRNVRGFDPLVQLLANHGAGIRRTEIYRRIAAFLETNLGPGRAVKKREESINLPRAEGRGAEHR